MSTALATSAVVGTVYAANCLLMTPSYLKDQNVPNSPETRYMTRGIAGGVVGLVTASALAYGSASADTVKVVGLANVAAFTTWAASGIHKNFMSAEPAAQGPKVDLAICASMLSLFALAMLKK